MTATMGTPVVIKTLRDPHAYSQAQVDEMCQVWALLNRGVLEVLIEPEPDRSTT